MTHIRIATHNDKSDFYRLWKICFGDSDAFCDWFFENRFAPEYSVVLEAEGEIVSCMQAFPYIVHIRGKEIPSAMLCGVSTHPEHRGKGYMGKIFSYEMNHLQKLGCVVAPHTPAILPSYFSFGHLPVANANYLESEEVPAFDSNVKLVLFGKERWSELYPLYTAFSKKYSGILARTKADFLRKAADYAADGGQCAAYIENNEVKGYAFYYQMEDAFLCVEAAAEDGYYKPLMEGLMTKAVGLRFLAKLPADVTVELPFTKTEVKQKGVMGLCNAAALLEALELEIPYGIQIKDHIVPENNGIFDFKGKPYTDKPVFEITAGHLLQVLVGYYDLEELKNEIIVHDEKKFEEIRALLPKQNCYIIDEY